MYKTALRTIIDKARTAAATATAGTAAANFTVRHCAVFVYRDFAVFFPVKHQDSSSHSPNIQSCGNSQRES